MADFVETLATIHERLADLEVQEERYLDQFGNPAWPLAKAASAGGADQHGARRDHEQLSRLDEGLYTQPPTPTPGNWFDATLTMHRRRTYQLVTRLREAGASGGQSRLTYAAGQPRDRDFPWTD